MSVKFEALETVIIFIKNGTPLVGNFLKYPEPGHPYWYIRMYEDTSLIAIADSFVDMIVRPSEQYMAIFLKTINASQNSGIDTDKEA